MNWKTEKTLGKVNEIRTVYLKKFKFAQLAFTQIALCKKGRWAYVYKHWRHGHDNKGTSNNSTHIDLSN